MSKDLIRRTDLIRKTSASRHVESQQTEVDEAALGLAEGMLFGTPKRPEPAGPPRIMLALDCTTSMGEYIEARKISLETARAIANGLFAKAPGLQVQSMFFRGDDQFKRQPRQFQISKKWYTTAYELARAIAAIDHWPGWTQHCRLLRHTVAEAKQQQVQELVIVSDAFEECTPLRPHGDDLTAARVHARRLRDLGTKIVFAYRGSIRGGCPLDRAGVNAEQAFREITDENGGYCFLLNPTDVGEQFGAIAAQANLAANGDVVAATKLLEHHKTIPFELNVVGQQVNAKCHE